MPRILSPVVLVLIALYSLTACAPAPPADLARRGDIVDVLHGVEVPDPYRWLEDGASDEVRAWTEARNAAFFAATEDLAQRRWLYDRHQQLERHDDESSPRPCLLSERLRFETKKADQDKWVLHMQDGPDGEDRIILDPNTWEETETLDVFEISPDCRYAAFTKSNAGDERPVLRVMDLDTLELLPDTFRGWRQGHFGGVTWLHDNSGFYYTAQPLPGEVPEGEHHYWFRVWFHTLGTSAEKDQLYFYDPEVKEHRHHTTISEDGRWLLKHRVKHDHTAAWLVDLEQGGEARPVVTGMDSEYDIRVFDDRLIITTDWEAPNYRVMTASVDQPGREHWRELIPESEDGIWVTHGIAGKLFVQYFHQAATRIAVYELDGTYLHDVPLPTLGFAYPHGNWSKPEVRMVFSSFAHPPAIYRYDPEANELTLHRESPIDFDPSGIVVDRVTYPSKDGTEVGMFLVHHEDAPTDGSVPYLLIGYGGFNAPRLPGFLVYNATWVEAGGGVAIAHVRGGGEHGRAWHEAGKRKNKQNSFDDFIAAADTLVAEGYTARERLAITGTSNGGLLVSAAITQRPDLCKAVLALVPVTDMVRFYKFGMGNIWTEEFGSPDDPEMFEALYAYSPYHRVQQPGADYPALLIVSSANDTRVDPLHARKFAAAARWADADHGREEPILLHLQAESGHGHGVTIDRRVGQLSRQYGFLMAQVGLAAPEK